MFSVCVCITHIYSYTGGPICMNPQKYWVYNGPLHKKYFVNLIRILTGVSFMRLALLIPPFYWVFLVARLVFIL